MRSAESCITLTIPSQTRWEGVALAVMQSLNPDLARIPHHKVRRLRTALAEAVLNAIEHGNRFDPHLNVTIRFIIRPLRLEIIVQDAGASDETVLPPAKPDIHRKVQGLESKRGWGLFLIQSLVDEFYIDTQPGQGHRIGMISYLSPTDSQVIE